MTPGARAAAAIEILERVLAGQTAEQAITNWGRANRFAGSGDRAALRDIVFDILRCRLSCAALGGAMTGRGLVLGWARRGGQEGLFDGVGHSPAPPMQHEIPRGLTAAEALDCPDWLEPHLRHSLGDDFLPVMQALQSRAPVFLRVNLRKSNRAAAQARLAAEGIEAIPHALAAGALEVRSGARRLAQAQAYADGLVELQDAASQAVVEMLPLKDGMHVLDLCAGGGGKTLAMGARAELRLWAHDISQRRMADLPARAARAGLVVTLTEDPEVAAPYDLVLADVPCSGSGSWRRDPEGKWALTPERLAELTSLQANLLDRAAAFTGHDGCLAYATCSLLEEENEGQVTAFLHRHPEWRIQTSRRFTPLDGGDGFYCAVLARPLGG